MEYRILTQKEFLDAYRNGTREFSHVLMQFFDISHATFTDLCIKESKIMFCTFRETTFRNTVFDNCTFYFGSFYTGEFVHSMFTGCTMELTLFDTIQFDDSSIHKSTLLWNALLNSTLPDMATSSHMKTITNLSQLTHAEIEELTKSTLRNIERLDLTLRLKIKELIRQDLDRYNISQPKKSSGAYGKDRIYEQDAPLTYREVQGALESFFPYFSSNAYTEKKSVYKTDTPYRKASS